MISGLKGYPEKDCIFNVILVLGAIATAVTSFDTLFQVETKKNAYKLMLVELREIRTEFIFYYEHKRKELDIRIKDYLFPKYQGVVAQSKSLIEKEKDKT